MKKTLGSVFLILLVIIMLVSSIIPANALSVGDEGYIVNTGSETYTGYDYSYSLGGGTYTPN